MDAVSMDIVRELLAHSLLAWRVTGDVCMDDGAVLVSGDCGALRVERAPRDQPFRWMVSVNGRARPALSLVAVLRQVRTALDPGYMMNRATIAVSPLVPP